MSYRRKTEEEWEELIREFKNSGLAPSTWCKKKGICRSTFLARLNNVKTTGIVAGAGNQRVPCIKENREIVELKLGDPSPASDSVTNDVRFETAIRLSIKGVSVDISNAAKAETIFNTIRVLEGLC